MKYAFIDVQNTASTTEQLLGFVIDWHKLCDYLNKNRTYAKDENMALNRDFISIFYGLNTGSDIIFA